MQHSSFKRRHPYLGEWVVFAPATQTRPWSGSTTHHRESKRPRHDPGCHLCPGVERAVGIRNPEYTGVHVFDNDFPTFSFAGQEGKTSGGDSYARGTCRVVCFSPDHSLTLAEMDTGGVENVLFTIRTQVRELAGNTTVKYILPFENKGEIIGVSNPHPHGQIYAMDFVPRIPAAMYMNAFDHKRNTGGCLFCSVMETERTAETRIVTGNDHWIAYVPSFARHTFEVHIMPRRHVATMPELRDDEISSLARIYREMLIRYDNLFRQSFPNITLFYNAPFNAAMEPSVFHFHIQFCPPLRDHDKMKYTAGFETGCGTIINPSDPDTSAALLREQPTVHYRDSGDE